MNEFKTRDLGLAGYLRTEGMILNKSTLEGGIVFFFFEDKMLCEKMEVDYKFQGAKVEAKRYNDTLKTLKAEINKLKTGERNAKPIAYK